LVIPMLVLGGVNTFVIHPRASRLIQNESSDSESSAALDRSFSRAVRTEALLGVAVLLVASILVFQQPAREHQQDESPKSSTSEPMDTDPDNGKMRHVDGGGLGTAVLEERNGRWRIVHWHSSAPRRAPSNPAPQY